MIASLLTYLIVGIIALVALGVVLTVVGAAIGLASFLLFKVAPILLIGWVAIKLFSRSKRKQISEADRRWLES